MAGSPKYLSKSFLESVRRNVAVQFWRTWKARHHLRAQHWLDHEKLTAFLLGCNLIVEGSKGLDKEGFQVQK
jgi:hypothetical protein